MYFPDGALFIDQSVVLLWPGSGASLNSLIGTSAGLLCDTCYFVLFLGVFQNYDSKSYKVRHLHHPYHLLHEAMALITTRLDDVPCAEGYTVHISRFTNFSGYGEFELSGNSWHYTKWYYWHRSTMIA
jgi:hypothetical protein